VYTLSSYRHSVSFDHYHQCSSNLIHEAADVMLYVRVSSFKLFVTCYSSTLFVDDKVPHVIVSNYVCCHSACALPSRRLL